MTAASAGDTINVLPGAYTGNVVIDKNVTLQSTGGRAVTTISGVSGVGALGTIVVSNNTTGVTIGGAGKGFTIVGIDNGSPGLENAAIYVQGGHTGLQVRDNEIQANGDVGFLSEFGVTISGWVIDGNTFSGKTFVGANPADNGFANQFTTPNVPRQLVVIGNGGGNLATATATNITFTNNLISGVAGGLNVASQEQGNQLVTLDVAGSTITGNTFSGTTTRFAGSLRVRRPGTTISGNTFNSTGLGINTSQLFVQNNTTPLQAMVAANTFDKGVFLDGSTTVGLSIQGFVSAVPSGTTINVLPGSYTGNVVIDKNVTLQSTGGRAVTTISGVSGVGALGTIVVSNNTTGVIIGGAGKGFTIVGIDNGSPGLENAAIYLQGGHTGLQVRDNEIQANGDVGFLSEFGVTISGWVIDGNTFSGKTFVGANPADNGFANQFSTPNVPRQLVVIGNGGGNLATATATNITFTNNLISGVAGGLNVASQEQGNQLVTLDVAGSTITGNTFSGTTTRFAGSLRVRRPDTTISGNTFNSTGLGINTSQLFVQNNTTPLQTIVAANTFDKGVYLNGSTTVGLSVQAFVAAVPAGTTISVLGGTYAENVNAAVNSVTLAPGASIGKILINGGLVLDANDTLAFDINGPLAGVGYDQWEVAGAVTLGGAACSFGGSYAVFTGQTFVLVNNDLADAVTGAFAGLPEGSIIPNFIGSGLPAQITYAGGDGNDVVLTILGVSVVGPNLVIESPSGSGASNDSLTLAINGSNLRLSDPNNPLFAGPGAVQIDPNTIEIPLASLTGSIVFQGTGGDDVLTLDFTLGNPVPPGGITFNGGSGNDGLRVVGNGQTVVYSPDSVTNGNGVIDIGGRTVTFTGLEPVDFVGVAFTLNLPGANDVVDLANGFLIDGTTPATVVSGTSAGVGFENARVRNCAITIDTTGVAGTDAITLTSMDNAHLNSSLTITTGVEPGDTITVNGTTTVSGTTSLNTTTVALNADVTNTVTGSVVNDIAVSAPGQIQDAISLASPGKTISVGPGTYQEDIAVNKVLTLQGAGAATTIIQGVLGGATETVVLGSSQIIDGFTITRQTGAGENNIGLTVTTGATGSTVRNCIFTGNRTAIYLNGGNSQATITRNTIDDNRTGFLLPDNSGYGAYVITENNITNNKTFGVLFNAVTTIDSGFTLSRNNISGNYGVQVENNSGSVVNASANWWGTAAPVVTASTINGTFPPAFSYPGPAVPQGAPYPYDITGSAATSVDYTPLIVSGVDADLVTPGFQPDRTILRVVSASPQSGSAGRIHEGASTAVASGVVNVDSGTYAESVTLTQAVDVRGPNWNVSPNGGMRAAEAVIVPPSTNTSTGAVVTITSSGVSFRGFTVDGDNTSLPASGVGLGGPLGTSIDAARCVFLNANGVNGITIAKNIAKNAVNGLRIEQTTNYFASGGPAGAVRSTNILLDDNLVQDLTGTGIRLGNSMYAKVTNNTITNADNGIAFSSFRISDAGSAADRVIQGNTISARFAGIWTNLFHASPYALVNNTITVAPAATLMAPTPQVRTSWYGIIYSTVSAPQNFTNQPNLPLVVTPEWWTATGNVIDGAALEPGSTGYGYWLFYVDNNRDSASADHFGQISGGSVSNVNFGIMLKNRDTDPATSFGTAAVGAHAAVSGVAFSLRAGGTGFRLIDDATWTTSNPAPLLNKRNVQLAIGSGTTITGGATGLHITRPASFAQPDYNNIVGGALSDLAFSGQTGDYITLVGTPNGLDGTSSTFDAANGATASQAALFDIEDKITHKLDDTALGLVRVKTGHVFVSATGSLDRGITAASVGDVVNVENGYPLVLTAEITKNVTFAGTFAITAGTFPADGTATTVLSSFLTRKGTSTVTADMTGMNANQYAAVNANLGAFSSITGAPVTILRAAVIVGYAAGIQSGIDYALSGDTVQVSGGTYTESVSTSGKAITLSAAGTGTAQVIVNGSFTLDGNDTFPVELNGLVPGTEYDQWVINGTVTLGGATLVLGGSRIVLLDDAFTFISNDAVDAITGTFNALPEGVNLLFNTISRTLTYAGGDGNDVVLKRPPLTPVFIGTAGGGSLSNSAPNEDATGSVGRWESIRTGAVLSSNGHIAFRGHLELNSGIPLVTSGNFQGIWRYDGTDTRLKARSGTAAPEVSGAVFDQLPLNPSVSPNGLMTFYGALRIGSAGVTAANNYGLWSEMGGGSMRLLLREGDPIISGKTYRSSAAVSASNVNTAALNARLSTGTAVLHLDVSTPVVQLSVVAEEGQNAPGGGTWIALDGNSSDPRLSTNGDLGFIGWELVGTSQIQGIYSRLGSTPVGSSGVILEARAGNPAPGTGGATFSAFERPTVYNGGMAFRGFLNLNGDNAAGNRSQGVWAGAFGSLLPVVRTGDTNAQIPTIPAGRAIGSVWSPFSSDSGAIAMRVTLTGGPGEARAIMGNTSGTMSVIAKVGDAAPGLAGETFANFDHPVIGDGNQIAFTAATDTGSYGIWKQASGGGSLSLVMRIGETLSTSEGNKIVSQISLPGITTDDRKFEVRCIDATGRMLIHVTFDDGTSSLLLGL